MSIEITLKLLTVIGALLGVWKFFYDFRSGNKRQLREDYEFANRFLDTVESRNLHPYLLEKGYQALAGTTKITAKEAAYILSLESPTTCLTNFVVSSHLLEKVDITGVQKLRFKKQLQSGFSRGWRKALYLFLYFVCIVAALAPFILAEVISGDIIFTLMLTVPFFGFIAVMAIKSFAEIRTGESLVRNQTHHTMHIVTN